MATIDILLLHGSDNHTTPLLLKYLRDSFNFNVNIVENSPTKSKNQKDKVETYIKESRLPIVIATFDGSNKNIRPNVANEIALCAKLRKNNFLILREKRKTGLASIGSNIENQYPEIIFEKDDLTALYVRLNKEIIELNLLTKVPVKFGQNLSTIRKEANEISDFLDKMDRIWEDEFDIAADFIERNDWKTEKEFQNKLDAFFLKYWAVFDSMIRKKKEGKALKKISDENLEQAYHLAFDVWFIVVRSRLEVLDTKFSNVNPKSSRPECSKSEIDKFHKIVDNMNKSGNSKRKKETIQKKLTDIRVVNEQITNCL